ncbi:nucleoside triphosphate hydrolase [Vibrio albus]|uniref:Nucleoside triphosphate hydrolase n=1 Tax=Vibrio albus TaxID=2200953 RepID=A0A2U3BDE3_9VIBR|nr:YcjX family protein [Vibrio albus]PWI34772.1 nucleoside triphosphate hydrolase [Vibrio albus]
MSKVQQEISDFIHRGMDSHLRLAVTGLSRAGKTAFITSLVNQLLYSSTHDNLPLLLSARDKNLIGAKRVPQSNMMVPRFAYDEAIDALHSQPPKWPEPTRDVSEIRLAIRFRPQKGAKKWLAKSSTLYLDIIDYPGEWLLDLPLLNMTYSEWSRHQFEHLKGLRKQLAEKWMEKVSVLDPLADADEKHLAELSGVYTDYLHQCKQQGLHWVQPGRFVLPGELEGAPVLQFFPFPATDKDTVQKAGKHSVYAMLKSRYEEYQQRVVKAFYKQYFSTFDRQIVLVDCLQPLNAGYESFQDMKNALEQIMRSFRYGRHSLLHRLFSPRIDKILFAATKADHVTPEQHRALSSLLQQMVHPAWQNAAFEGIDMSCISMASIQSTTTGFVTSKDTSTPAIQGDTLEGEPVTLFPGDVPGKLPGAEFWKTNGFEFIGFRPMPSEPDTPLPHVRMDKALQYLIGDKLI